jgi:hypothetical protein
MKLELGNIPKFAISGASMPGLQRPAVIRPQGMTSTGDVFFAGNASLLDANLSLDSFGRLLTAKVNSAAIGNRANVIAELTEVLDKYLQNQWNDISQPQKRQMALDALKSLLGKRGQGNLVMAQINTVPGDVKGNALKVMRYIQHAEAIGADAIVFPESTLLGYPVRDIITRHPSVVQENMKYLRAIAEKTVKAFSTPWRYWVKVKSKGLSVNRCCQTTANLMTGAPLSPLRLQAFTPLIPWSPARGVLRARSPAASWPNLISIAMG